MSFTDERESVHFVEAYVEKSIFVISQEITEMVSE